MSLAGERGIAIRVHELDNVAIVANSGGLKSGARLTDGTLIVSDVAHGHKVALSEIKEKSAIIRYGEIIGYAVENIKPGSWVNESLVQLPEPPILKELSVATRPASVPEPLSGYTFEGFRNTDGSVGTKNVLAITTSVQCVAGVTDYVVNRIKEELLPHFPNVDDVIAINHSYGCGVAIDAPAAVIPIRTLQNITRNPNFGGEVMVIGLGCEKLTPERLVPDERPGCDEGRSPVLTLQNPEFQGFGDMISAIM